METSTALSTGCVPKTPHTREPTKPKDKTNEDQKNTPPEVVSLLPITPLTRKEEEVKKRKKKREREKKAPQNLRYANTDKQ